MHIISFNKLNHGSYSYYLTLSFVLKGDDDFMPSLRWTGRKGGFEFKLGERGMGYYRTGRTVVVPSNMAYT
jgi:hypothetical protein